MFPFGMGLGFNCSNCVLAAISPVRQSHCKSQCHNWSRDCLSEATTISILTICVVQITVLLWHYGITNLVIVYSVQSNQTRQEKE